MLFLRTQAGICHQLFSQMEEFSPANLAISAWSEFVKSCCGRVELVPVALPAVSYQFSIWRSFATLNYRDAAATVYRRAP